MMTLPGSPSSPQQVKEQFLPIVSNNSVACVAQEGFDIENSVDFLLLSIASSTPNDHPPAGVYPVVSSGHPFYHSPPTKRQKSTSVDPTMLDVDAMTQDLKDRVAEIAATQTSQQ